MNYKKYENNEGIQIDPIDEIGNIAFPTIEILPFLKGLPLTKFTFSWIYCMRPSLLRICSIDKECDFMNSKLWRITVYIDKNNTIDRILQEVMIAYDEGTEYLGMTL